MGRTGKINPNQHYPRSYVTLLPFPYVILNLETTGGTPLHDCIIEITLIRFEEGMESERWETLQLHYLRLKQPLLPLKLRSWPYSGRIGIRE